jgi:heat shock protein HtpX
MSNQIKTWFYLVVLTALVMFCGQYFGGRQGLLVGFILAMGMNFFTYFYSDKLILAAYGAQKVEGVDPYGLQELVSRLALQTKIPKPSVYIIPSETPNAFATGRSPKYASVAVTEGIIRLLNKDELASVLAHELSHVEHRDTLLMAIAATLGTTVMLLANLFRRTDEASNNFARSVLIAIFAPFAATFIQLAISRSREYMADAHSAELTSNPQALATALWKIHNYSQAIPLGATQATAHLFIVNPLFGGGVNSLFSTHPPVEERIKRLIGRTL